MKSLCVNHQAEDLLALEGLINSGQLDGPQAWSCFNDPRKKKKFSPEGKPEFEVPFTARQVASYKALRQTVQQELFARSGGSCSYCRRPVGHYGWAWHIEHVYPKAKHAKRTFKLSNLTVGCVHCNQWKGARVDRQLTQRAKLPIVDPSSSGFRYSDHLKYVQIGTESLHFAKYETISPEGTATHRLLEFSELERAYAIDSMDGTLAALHDRLTRAMSAGLSSPDGSELVGLLADLRSSIYKQASA